MFTENKFKLVHNELATMELGDPETAELTIVFIHGWLDNSGSFIKLMKECHQLMPDVHLVAVDLPGHGLSAHRSDDNYYLFHDYIDDIHQFLTALSPKKLLLVGHSLGAFLATCYSAAFSENVAGLVQIEGFGPLAESPNNTVKRLREGVLSRQQIREKRERYFFSIDEMVDIRAKVNHLRRLEVMPIVKRGSVFDGQVWKWRHDAKLNADSLIRMSRKNAEAIMKEVRCPHLVILGQSGFDYLLSQAKLEFEHPLAAQNEQFSVEYIPGGHHCHIQQTQLTSELIFGLVNKI
ncbi:alpha/beta fold hydrolase [Vibrio sp. VB16]|jgi:pimeloyl-ACP methyl ester carboxylesterase|uniref:alpha/beta fold hydrolase n=1 Tax=Vibrio sp. VB16 TaxID=2785746 RepID=UPI0018A09FE8|nr:alpha/beta hydrolase [Vibrio sp. VB16]UGA55608.1 alpha/beta hydrolase [Vibrio sp. VB16]